MKRRVAMWTAVAVTIALTTFANLSCLYVTHFLLVRRRGVMSSYRHMQCEEGLGILGKDFLLSRSGTNDSIKIWIEQATSKSSFRQIEKRIAGYQSIELNPSLSSFQAIGERDLLVVAYEWPPSTTSASDSATANVLLSDGTLRYWCGKPCDYEEAVWTLRLGVDRGEVNCFFKKAEEEKTMDNTFPTDKIRE